MARVRKPSAFGLPCLGRGFLHVDSSSFHHSPTSFKTSAKIKQSGRILGHEVTAVPLESSIHSNNFCQLKQNRERDVIPSSRATTHLNTSRPHKKLSAQKPMISNRSRLVPIFSPQYTIVILLITLLHSFITTVFSNPQEAEHLTALVGDSIVFNCHIEFPESHTVPYVIQWEKKGVEIPIFIWYENYLHTGDGYEGRVSRVVQQNSNFGLASLNLTRIRESDQGWYLCLVNFLNRSPRQDKNGTLFHLNVHAPPRFTMTPDDIVYASLGDPIILSCLAEGTPVPEILWHRGNDLVHTSASLAVANDGTELRISSIRQEDIGDYTCVAKNGQGSIRHTTKLVVAGGAVIIVPPLNVTRLEGDKLEMPCEARGLPGNLSVTWFRESHAIRSIPWLESRTLFKKDGSLVISPVHSDDRGLYSCEVTNGIGEPQRASAYIEVEYPARVTFTPTVQYLPLRLSGVVRCHVEAHPPFQFITWTKDARIFDPFETPNVGVLKNGSLLFEKVTHDNQGRYKCTPYNVHGTAGPSTDMEVLVREPPNFVTRPKAVYQQKIDDDVQMTCEAEGTPNPRITWRRADGKALPRDRSREDLGVLTLSKLRRTDFGFYECHVSNEVATLITTTHLVIEGTTPHSPYNITTESTEFSVILEWLPGYSGGSDYSQKYVIWYRQEGAAQWIPLDVDPPDSTKTVIDNLQPGTSYEFQVIGKNVLGDGMFSNIVKESTKGQRPPDPDPPGLSRATTSPSPTFDGDDDGPPPIAPENVTLTETSDGVLLTWNYPRRSNVAIAYFTVDYNYDDQWKRLSKTQLKPHEVSFLVNNLNAGKTYVFRVNAHTLTSQASSEKVTYVMPRKTKNKAITAGVVGGILFFIVAIILAVCTVKCVNKRNKRRRREQEKAYSMVACQATDTRNGNNPSPPSANKSAPPRKGWTSRLPSLMEVPSLDSCLSHAFKFNPFQGNIQKNTKNHSTRFVAVDVNLNSAAIEAADWLEYGAAEIKQRRSNRQIAPFGNQSELLKQEGWISRPPEINSAGPGIWQFHTLRKEDEYESPQERSQSSHQYYQLTPASHQVESGFYNVRDRLLWPQIQPANSTKELSFPPNLHSADLVFHPISNSNSLMSSASPHFISPQLGKYRLHPQTPVLASRGEVIRSSSPGSALLFTPTLANFSDMSSVQHPSSAEQSYAAPRLSSSSHVFPVTERKMKIDNFNNLFPDSVALTSSVPNSRYIRELPSLLPLHQELAVHQSSKEDVSKPPLQMRTVRAEIHSIDTDPHNSSRVQNEFGLLLNTAGRHFHAPPPFRSPPPPFISTISYPSSSQRPLATSSPPRTRHSQSDGLSITGRHLAGTRANVESRRRRSPLTIAVRLSPARTQQRLSERSRNQIVEYSPQSQSSSSGFDSKNTSQQNQSASHFGSGHFQYVAAETHQAPTSQKRTESIYVNWPIKGVTPPSHLLLDASVDNHYEFDTTQSPTGHESSSVNATYFPGNIPSTITTRSGVLVTDSATANRNKKIPTRPDRSENIEARVQAMKEEFQEYRKRRARGLLESAC